MACGCGKKNLQPTTTAQAEAMMASGSVPSADRYVVVGGELDGQKFPTYVAAKSAQRAKGGKIRAI